MNTTIIYKGIKERIKTVAPTFYFIGQYLRGKDNTSYVVPALYIEMPKNLTTVFFPGRIEAARNALVKIHLVTHAPYKNHDNPIQDSKLMEHEAMKQDFMKLLSGWSLVDVEGRQLTQQLIPVGDNSNNFTGTTIFSVVTFRTEFISYGLQPT